MIRHLLTAFVACSMLLASGAARAEPSVAEITAYQQKLAAYEKAHGVYQKVAQAYWDEIAAKRRIRIAKRKQHEPIVLQDYVLKQPPTYSGPPRPVDPRAPTEQPSELESIPVVADFLKAAAEEFGFVPDLPQNEAEFKRAYAKAASAAGLTKEQIVGVYAFETGGRGTYDMQSGITPTRTRAISPALGYNQLLSTNTVSLLAENGERYLAALHAKALLLRGEERRHFDNKIASLKKIVAYCRSVPLNWKSWDILAKTTRGGWGAHAAVLDIDVGPMLQVQKLLDSVIFARAKGYTATLTPAELELMNLTGDGNGIDLVTMPQDIRKVVPTSNFFQPGGYARNPVARRTGTVAKLFAELEGDMTRNQNTPGAQDLAQAF